jgi:hypothetical protein
VSVEKIEGVRFVERRTIVAQWSEEQSDEPPGRAPYATREVVVRHVQAPILDADVSAHVAALDRGLPRGKISEPSPLARTIAGPPA